MQETVFFAEKNIQVTNARIVISSQTYSMRNITSVKMVEIPPQQGCGLQMAFAGFFFLMFILAFSNWPIPMLILFVATAIILLIGGVFLAFAVKTTYALILSSSSGEIKAIESPDIDLIRNIVQAVNRGIVSQIP